MSITTWPAAVPGDFSRQPLPMLCVDAALDADYRARGDDCSELKTFIWYRTRRGAKAARRVARELATSGVAIVYPCDRDLAIQAGERHQVIHLAFGQGEKACRR